MTRILEILRGYGKFQDGLSFKAVVRHPLADETELLEKLGVKIEDCSSCDVLWAFENELIFVSLFSTINTIKKSHILYRFDDEALFGGKHFYVATLQHPLKTLHVEKTLRFLFGWLKDENNQIIKIKPAKPVKITDTDICE